MKVKEIDILVLSSEDIEKVFSGKVGHFLSVIENSFRKYSEGKALLPDKISQIFDEETQNRLNCLPATLLDEKICGVKWISVFPTNALKGMQNVSGAMLLSEIESGFPVAVMDSALCTAFRTAAVGTVAAKYLAKADTQSIGLIGAGEEARMHLSLLKYTFPRINKCYVGAKTTEEELAFIEEIGAVFTDIEFHSCNTNLKEAAVNSDIIVTATSAQAPLLKADWIGRCKLYIHVGGWEDEFEVALKADKIVCDKWDCVKHRTQTISRMYKQGILKDENIYADLQEIITGEKKGRENDEFVYFNSVGLAFVDIYLANEVYRLAKETGLGNVVPLQTENHYKYDTFKK